jgi:hypothetical protein
MDHFKAFRRSASRPGDSVKAASRSEFPIRRRDGNPVRMASGFHPRFGDGKANKLEYASRRVVDPTESLTSPFQWGRFHCGTAFFQPISAKNI